VDEHFREAAEGVGGLRVLLAGPGCCWLVEAPEAVKTKTRGSGGLIRFTVMGVAWVTAVFQWYRIFLLPGIGVRSALWFRGRSEPGFRGRSRALGFSQCSGFSDQSER
jgi:hypothetical protein